MKRIGFLSVHLPDGMSRTSLKNPVLSCRMRSPLLLKPLYLNGVILEYGAGERLVHARNRCQ
ncbi:hypothetical protein FBR02_15915 [Anaerolineae bacterium CFX9]|nr:hypothetical protein [Anaerolineae bacterium CFX9]